MKTLHIPSIPARAPEASCEMLRQALPRYATAEASESPKSTEEQVTDLGYLEYIQQKGKNPPLGRDMRDESDKGAVVWRCPRVCSDVDKSRMVLKSMSVDRARR